MKPILNIVLLFSILIAISCSNKEDKRKREIDKRTVSPNDAKRILDSVANAK